MVEINGRLARYVKKEKIIPKNKEINPDKYANPTTSRIIILSNEDLNNTAEKTSANRITKITALLCMLLGINIFP
jgi:hypothetical protein